MTIAGTGPMREDTRRAAVALRDAVEGHGTEGRYGRAGR